MQTLVEEGSPLVFLPSALPEQLRSGLLVVSEGGRYPGMSW